MKLCKDCRHRVVYTGVLSSRSFFCGRKSVLEEKTDPVTGKQAAWRKGLLDCNKERSAAVDGPFCGLEGRFYEAGEALAEQSWHTAMMQHPRAVV